MHSSMHRRWLTTQLRPVGALTSKPYAFTARPWELRSTDTVDVMNAMGSSIRVQLRGTDLLRVVPRVNDEINEEWIDDKTRFSHDGLKVQRLTTPLVRDVQDSSKWDAERTSWSDALNRVKANFTGSSSVRAVVGPSVDLFSAVALSDLIGGDLEVVGSSAKLGSRDLATQYRFNSTFANVEEADVCLLVGTNLNVDCPLLIARMRKAFLGDTMKIASVGPTPDLKFPVESVGLTAKAIVELAEGKHSFCSTLAAAEKPMIMVDSSVLDRSDAKTIMCAIDTISQNTKLVQHNEEGAVIWNGLNLVHRNANDVGLLDLGRTTAFDQTPFTNGEQCDVLYLCGVGSEDLPVSVEELRRSAKFVVFQGSHGDELASAADVLLPGVAWSEQSGVYVNMEGRAQQGRFANAAPTGAREDWKVIRALSEVLDRPTLPYDSEEAIEARLHSLIPSTSSLSYIEGADLPLDNSAELQRVVNRGYVNPTPLQPYHNDFYLQGHVVARASKTMAKCSKEFNESQRNFAQ